MKRLIYSIFGLAAIVALASCNKGINPEKNSVQGENLVTYSFGAKIATKTVLDGDAPKFVDGDELKICYITDAETKDAVGTVKGTIKGDVITFDAPAGIQGFYAIYPYSDTYYAKYDNVAKLFGVKLNQGKAKGTFADANGMVAYSTVDDAFFAFKNLTAILKIQAPSFADQVLGVRFRGVEASTNIDGSAAKFNGVVPIVTNGTSVTDFGNVTAEGTANMQTSSEAKPDTDGYYYIPVNPVILSGLGIWFQTETERPGTVNDKEYTFERGHIYTINNIESKLYPTDWYVSPDGTGDGKSEANPMSYADMRVNLTKMTGKMAYCYCYIGTTFHLAEGEYTGDALSLSFSDYVHFTIEGAGVDKTFIKHGTTLNGNANTTVRYKNLSFDGIQNNNTGSAGNGAAMILKGKGSRATFEKCKFSNNVAGNAGAAITSAYDGVLDDDSKVIVDCKNCVFYQNKALYGAAILVTASSQGGQLRFNNCRFDANAVDNSGSVLYSNASTANVYAAAVLFNGCTFYKNTTSTTTANGFSIMGNKSARVGFNNCTFNVQNKVAGANSCEILLTGSSVVANTTIWGSAKTGKRAMAQIGSLQTDMDHHATIVNSIVHLKNDIGDKATDYKALFLANNYFLQMDGSIYGGLNDYNGGAEEGTHYIFTNCVDRGTETNALTGAVGKNDPVYDGITHTTYSYTFSKAVYPGFSPMTKDAVQAKVKGTALVGEIFDAWLTEIGAYDVDILGKTRNTEKMTPGSLQVAYVE